LNAVGHAVAVLAMRDPEAITGVFTAGHGIEPVTAFGKIQGSSGLGVGRRDDPAAAA